MSYLQIVADGPTSELSEIGDSEPPVLSRPGKPLLSRPTVSEVAAIKRDEHGFLLTGRSATCAAVR